MATHRLVTCDTVSRLIDEATLRCRVRYRPAEIDFDVHDLRVAYRQDLGIAKSMAVAAAALVRDERALADRLEAQEIETGDRVAVRPATLEIRRTIDAIVERTGEVEIGGDERLDGGSVFVDVRLIAPAHDRCDGVGHLGVLRRGPAPEGARHGLRPYGVRLVVESEGLLIDELALCDDECVEFSAANSFASSFPSPLRSAVL